jgi:hypothetical protein
MKRRRPAAIEATGQVSVCITTLTWERVLHEACPIRTIPAGAAGHIPELLTVRYLYDAIDNVRVRFWHQWHTCRLYREWTGIAQPLFIPEPYRLFGDL